MDMRLGSLEQCYLSKDGILCPWDVEGLIIFNSTFVSNLVCDIIMPRDAAVAVDGVDG